MTDAPATHPVTLFTGQWADLPFEEVARLAAEWGYDGLEIACSGDHLDLKLADEEPGYLDERRIASWRKSMGTSHTACPARWFEIA